MIAALGCGGCVSNGDRLSSSKWFGTADDHFSVEADKVIVPGQVEAAERSEAGSITALLKDYYASSKAVRGIESEHLSAGTWETLGQDGSYAPLLLKYREDGFNASRGVCSYALNLLGQSHSRYRFTNKTTNLLAGAGASLMGIFEASAQSVSVYATGTALFQAWSQDFEEYAYLTASIGTVGKKVIAAQDLYRRHVEYGDSGLIDAATLVGARNETRAKLPPKSWGDATLQIQKYNDYCLATGMRTLIEEAVGKADIYFDPSTNSVEVLGRRTTQEMASILNRRITTEIQVQIDSLTQRIEDATADKSRKVSRLATAKSEIDRLKANPYATTVDGALVVDLARAEEDFKQIERVIAQMRTANPADPLIAGKLGEQEALRQNVVNAKALKSNLDFVASLPSDWETRADAEIQKLMDERKAKKTQLEASQAKAVL
ncbi:MAG TPA: hypothetical protein VNZ85_14620 [Caulobacter sp.]|nr:hypothetical protein [Caulobacter sp.]